MRIVVAGLAFLLGGCRGAAPSLWQSNVPAAPGDSGGAYMVCACDGVERQPTPSEAAGFREGERVDLYCEGRVHDCHRGGLRTPVSPHYQGPFRPSLQD
jgi:hypothetical protein